MQLEALTSLIAYHLKECKGVREPKVRWFFLKLFLHVRMRPLGFTQNERLSVRATKETQKRPHGPIFSMRCFAGHSGWNEKRVCFSEPSGLWKVISHPNHFGSSALVQHTDLLRLVMRFSTTSQQSSAE